MVDSNISQLVKTIALQPDLDYLYSRDQAAALYIKYTGACLKGVNEFIEKFSPEDCFALEDILKLTQNEQFSTAFVDQLRQLNVSLAESYGGGIFSQSFDAVGYDDSYTLNKNTNEVSFDRPNDNVLVTQENDSGTIKSGVAKNIDVEVKTNTELSIDVLKATERVLVYSATSNKITNGYSNPIAADVIKIDSQTSGNIHLDLAANSRYIVTVATIGSCQLNLRTSKPITFNAYGLCAYGNENLKVSLLNQTAINPIGKTSALAIDSNVKIDKSNGVTVEVANNVSGKIRIGYRN